MATVSGFTGFAGIGPQDTLARVTRETSPLPVFRRPSPPRVGQPSILSQIHPKIYDFVCRPKHKRANLFPRNGTGPSLDPSFFGPMADRTAGPWKRTGRERFDLYVHDWSQWEEEIQKRQEWYALRDALLVDTAGQTILRMLYVSQHGTDLGPYAAYDIDLVHATVRGKAPDAIRLDQLRRHDRYLKHKAEDVAEFFAFQIGLDSCAHSDEMRDGSPDSPFALHMQRLSSRLQEAQTEVDRLVGRLRWSQSVVDGEEEEALQEEWRLEDEERWARLHQVGEEAQIAVTEKKEKAKRAKLRKQQKAAEQAQSTTGERVCEASSSAGGNVFTGPVPFEVAVSPNLGGVSTDAPPRELQMDLDMNFTAPSSPAAPAPAIPSVPAPSSALIQSARERARAHPHGPVALPTFPPPTKATSSADPSHALDTSFDSTQSSGSSNLSVAAVSALPSTRKASKAGRAASVTSTTAVVGEPTSRLSAVAPRSASAASAQVSHSTASASSSAASSSLPSAAASATPPQDSAANKSAPLKETKCVTIYVKNEPEQDPLPVAPSASTSAAVASATPSGSSQRKVDKPTTKAGLTPSETKMSRKAATVDTKSATVKAPGTTKVTRAAASGRKRAVGTDADLAQEGESSSKRQRTTPARTIIGQPGTPPRAAASVAAGAAAIARTTRTTRSSSRRESPTSKTGISEQEWFARSPASASRISSPKPASSS